MYLFIFESIGTSELLLIGIVALIFLGPRKLPEMARKIGKMMSEFRGATSEFKQTWEREINFEEEAKALDLNALEAEPVARVESIAVVGPAEIVDAPAVKQIDPARFDHTQATEPAKSENVVTRDDKNDKKNWL